MAKKVWVRNASRGGVRIPEDVRLRTKERLERYAEEHFAGYYTRLDIRFHA